jgi:hypothetical protein
MEWTYTGEHVPWLRGQGFHIAASGTEPLIEAALTEAGFVIARGSGAGGERFRPLVDALRLPASAADNLDALADSLRDLAELWPGTDRLAMLWSSADVLVRSDLLAFTLVAEILREVNGEAWSSGLVFEAIAFVGPPFAADSPNSS